MGHITGHFRYEPFQANDCTDTRNRITNAPQTVVSITAINCLEKPVSKISDVTKLFKIRIRRMRISTSKIRRIRMRMSLDKGLLYHSECHTLIYVS